MFFLRFRMALLLGVMFAIVYAAVVVVGAALGLGNFTFYLLFSFALMGVQFWLGPKIVEWTMRIRYVNDQEFPDLHRIIADQARRTQIPCPRVCVSASALPNAFAFGRGRRDGRVCVTQGIMNLLNEEELTAVIGHEISHLKNRDVLTITLLSVIPMILYRLAWQSLFFGNRRDSRGGNTALIGLAAFLFYFITNLLVLYASRIREYFADQGAIDLGNRPAVLATALYKLVYGSARVDKSAVKEAVGIKAFFLNDPSRANQEIRELAQLDLDRSGTIDPAELSRLRNRAVHLNFSDRLMEVLSTHPNMLKRIKRLAEMGR